MDWNTETVNIIYASNDGYAGHLAASLYSLLDHNRNIPRMDIYILSVGMSEAYRAFLTLSGSTLGAKRRPMALISNPLVSTA